MSALYSHIVLMLINYSICYGDTCTNILDALDNLESQVQVLKIRDTEQRKILEAQSEVIKQLQETLGVLTGTQPSRREVLSKRLLLADDGLVAFTAKIKDHKVENLALYDTILFPTVDLNAGAGFSPATGRFVAPRSGVYLFSLSLLAHNGGIRYGVHGEIVHNNVPVARALAVGEPNDHRDQGSVTVLINLLHTDEVWVRSVDAQNVTLNGDLFSVFSGYLLWPTE